jgi:hypothetical protein
MKGSLKTTRNLTVAGGGWGLEGSNSEVLTSGRDFNFVRASSVAMFTCLSVLVLRNEEG